MTPFDQIPPAPAASMRSWVHRVHGEDRVDPYYWLQDGDDPAVIAHLQAENAYADALMAPLAPLREQLYQEFVGRIQETDVSVPVRLKPFLYYTRTVAGAQYPIYCRRRDADDAEEQVILDANVLANGHDYFDLGLVEVSPDHRYMVYAEDADGSERYTLRIFDLESGAAVDEAIADTAADAQWAADNQTLFYTRLDASMRPYQAYRHRLGEPVATDKLIIEEPDEAFFVGLDKSKDERYLMLALESNDTSEVYYWPAAQPESAPRLCSAREAGVEYAVEHHDGRFFVLTNRDAVNFRVLVTSDFSRPPAQWETIVAHDDAVTLEAMEVFARHLVLYVRENGLTGIRVLQLPDFSAHTVAFDEAVYSVDGGANPEFDSRWLRFVYTSMITPACVYEYHMDTGERHLLKQAEIPSGFDSAAYATERVFATAPDGTQVPVSLVYHRERARERPAPCLLHGYGAYGVSMDPGFSTTRLSLLDRGIIFAIAHVRGGGDLGERWKNDGKRDLKMNTFTDFISAAEHLITTGYTSAQCLALMGGSAGGLLVGAVLNLRPQLFAAALAQVPFVDVLSAMEDPSLPLTVIEYDEWGNPADASAYHAIHAYDPYLNVRAADYPAVLVTSGLNDPRVAFWGPVKWIARLRRQNTGSRPLLLKMDMGSGHGGASGRYDALREIALEYAFVIDRLGARQS